MILVLAGTQDGREIVQYLKERHYPVIASVVSDYGKKLLEGCRITVNGHPLTESGLRAFIEANGVDVIVDATHPYAVNISMTAMKIAASLPLTYIRYERQPLPLPNYKSLHIVRTYEEAASAAASLGKTIFLTTGSRNLKTFALSESFRQCVYIARVLPEPEVLRECRELGFLPKQVIAMQGPFSHDLNLQLYLKAQADVVVMKNSGSVGGTDTKLTAAMALDLPVVMLERPAVKYPAVAVRYEEIINLLKK